VARKKKPRHAGEPKHERAAFVEVFASVGGTMASLKFNVESPMQSAIHLCHVIGDAFAHGRFVGKIPLPECVAAEFFQAITRWVAREDGGWSAVPYGR